MNTVLSLARAAAIAAAALIGAHAAAQKVNMTPKFANGDAGQFTLNTENAQNIAIPGSPDKNMSTRFQSRLRLALTDATADKAVVHITYEQISFKLDSPGMKTEFDSDWPAIRDSDSMIAPLIRSAVGMTLTATLSTADGVGEVEGADTVVPVGATVDQVRQLLNPAGLREFLAMIYNLKQPGPHQVGEPWTVENTVPNLVGTTRFVETYKIIRLDGERAKITINGTGSLEPKKEGAPAGAEFVEFKQATIEGDAEWDIGANCLARLSRTLVMKVADNNPVQQGKNMLQTVTTKTVIEKKK